MKLTKSLIVYCDYPTFRVLAILRDNTNMINVNLKGQIDSGSLFKQNMKNNLNKNLVSNFEHKETNMNLQKESEKEDDNEEKKKLEPKSDPYKSKVEEIGSDPVSIPKKILNLMKII